MQRQYQTKMTTGTTVTAGVMVAASAAVLGVMFAKACVSTKAPAIETVVAPEGTV